MKKRPRSVSPAPPYPWSGAAEPAYVEYMQHEWGVPVHDDRRLFEMLSLEVFQAGLSWWSVLKRRDSFARAFCDWQISRVARLSRKQEQQLMSDAGIIRNQRKIRAVISNARAALAVQKEEGSLDNYFWGFVHGKPLRQNTRCRRWEELPAESPESQALAKDMKARGFTFVGPVSCYAFMQAVGLVDDRIGSG